jgi:hypothetical protein
VLESGLLQVTWPMSLRYLACGDSDIHDVAVALF